MAAEQDPQRVTPEATLTVPEAPLCSFCGKPVEILTAKTDENGKSIHEVCYVRKMLGATPPSQGAK
jgi:hypothetical protein